MGAYSLEMNGCVITSVAIDDLGLKHHAISINSVYQICIVLDQFNTEILQLYNNIRKQNHILSSINSIVYGFVA